MISVHQAAVPPCLQVLGSLATMLTKAADHCVAHAIDPATLLQARLAADMFPCARQVQTASDFARSVGVRLTGLPHTRMAEDAADFPALQARLADVAAYLRDLPPAAFDDAQSRQVPVPAAEGERRIGGLAYLQVLALPNLYFHATIAYAILRHCGVALRKPDFIGPLETPRTA